MQVLIVAPNASSRFGGEAFLSLKYFELLLRRGQEARLIAHSRNRANRTETFPADQGRILCIEDRAVHRVGWTVFPEPLRGRWM